MAASAHNVELVCKPPTRRKRERGGGEGQKGPSTRRAVARGTHRIDNNIETDHEPEFMPHDGAVALQLGQVAERLFRPELCCGLELVESRQSTKS